MKARFNIYIFTAILGLALLCSKTFFAQEVTPTPDGKESKKKACLRAWNYSYLAEIPGLAVCLGPVGEKPPDFEKAIWLKRGMPSPKRSTWKEIPPGNYEVFVFKDEAKAGNMGDTIGPGIPLPSNILNNRQGVSVKPGTYQTIIITAQNGKITAQIIDDNLPPGSPRKLRFYKFNTPVIPTISLIGTNGQIQPLATKVEQSDLSFPVIGAPQAQSYQVTFQNKDSQMASLNLELDFSSSSSCSIIMAPDRYNNLGVEFSIDAPYTTGESAQ